MASTLLIIEDDPKMRRLLELILGQEGYFVTSVATGEDGLQRLSEQSGLGGFELVITDLQMPRMTGMDVLERIKKEYPLIPVLILTGFGTVKTAVEAMKKGAFDYMTKPIDNEELKVVVKRALEVHRLYSQHNHWNTDLRERYGFDRIVGKSEQFQRAKNLLSDVAQTDYTVLISGESGTGKELMARAIHYGSPRAAYPMVTIHCGAIPETLLESELFGYVKGAFTDAKTSKPGRLKMANGGTVFLDEVAELSPMTQVKLLRVLQEKEIDPIGATQSIKVDIRIVAATNKDLFEEVNKGKFRHDLYYRVNVFPVHIPPLRARKGDIPLLLDYFVNFYNRELNNGLMGFSPQALAVLENYPWPGNVRELQNLVERMMIVSKGKWVEVEDLQQWLELTNTGNSEPKTDRTGRWGGMVPAGEGDQARFNSDFHQGSGELPAGLSAGQPSLLSLGLSLEQLEGKLIREALEKASGNVTEAARLLQITRNTLRYRIQKYGLENMKCLKSDAE